MESPGTSRPLNSYNIYLAHYPFVMLFPLLLSGWTNGPALVKWGIVALSSALLSDGMSEYGIKRFSRGFAACLGALFAIVVVAAR